jgi:hypothetical protein
MDEYMEATVITAVSNAAPNTIFVQYQRRKAVWSFDSSCEWSVTISPRVMLAPHL